MLLLITADWILKYCVEAKLWELSYNNWHIVIGYHSVALFTGIPKNHNAFPSTPVNLAGFQDNVEILSSMIRPKKLTVIGSDGKLYPFLCKPKDDLRKDGRLMEFNDIINKLLRKDTQSRRMQLYIKTYVSIFSGIIKCFLK